MTTAQKYRVLQVLGQGGMGMVYKGMLVGQSGFERPIVIKQLKNHDPDHLKLFVEEARRYAVLDHENIGRIFDFEVVDQERCIILEFIDGWSLVDYLRRHEELERLPDVELSVFMTSRVCRALQYVYERAGIVHRDISPSNIMMTREGAVKLIDFGIAARSGKKEASLTGKPAYMAPEMVLELQADNRSDLFSLGAVLYEMLTGERLFQGPTTSAVLQQVVAGHAPSPRSKNASIPESVMAILARALQRTPAHRFASAGEMGEACEHMLYDRGYGPTNLTLKHYLRQLFPEASLPLDGDDTFPRVETSMIPIDEAPTTTSLDRDGATLVSPMTRAFRTAPVAGDGETAGVSPVPTEPASPRPKTPNS